MIGAPGLTVKCPLCDWQHTEEAIAVSNDTLASIFGVGTLASNAWQKRNARIEQAIDDHFRSHGLVEWVRAVVNRDERIAQLEAQ